MPVEDTPVHPHGVRHNYKAGCFNGQPPTTRYLVQNGWNSDGTRRMLLIENTASKQCRQMLDLPECEGCTYPKDHEYINKMRNLK